MAQRGMAIAVPPFIVTRAFVPNAALWWIMSIIGRQPCHLLALGARAFADEFHGFDAGMGHLWRSSRHLFSVLLTWTTWPMLAQKPSFDRCRSWPGCCPFSASRADDQAWSARPGPPPRRLRVAVLIFLLLFIALLSGAGPDSISAASSAIPASLASASFLAGHRGLAGWSLFSRRHAGPVLVAVSTNAAGHAEWRGSFEPPAERSDASAPLLLRRPRPSDDGRARIYRQEGFTIGMLAAKLGPDGI